MDIAAEWERRATQAEARLRPSARSRWRRFGSGRTTEDLLESTELDFAADGTFTKVIAGLQTVANLIATLPDDKRLQALEAAERSYFATACDLGYDEEEAHRWAAAVMARLRAEHREEQ